MIWWEYAVLHWEAVYKFQSWEYTLSVETPHAVTNLDASKFFEHLNALGSEGWELITGGPVSSYAYPQAGAAIAARSSPRVEKYIFKRRFGG